MTEYLGDAESPIDKEGWLHTGDLGFLDDEGHLWITGRSKDVIIRGGENIAPVAVERALMAIPSVVEVAVVGVPHPDLGEEVMAFVVVDSDSVTTDDLAAGLRGNIASFAIPSRWQIGMEPLPTNHTHKVDKNALSVLGAEIASVDR
jgi:acyl-CoA synthetase (AMP-forming)/AMP-acid ligase II